MIHRQLLGEVNQNRTSETKCETLKMEGAWFSKTLTSYHQTTRCENPEELDLNEIQFSKFYLVHFSRRCVQCDVHLVQKRRQFSEGCGR
jgi:hypothetical protein